MGVVSVNLGRIGEISRGRTPRVVGIGLGDGRVLGEMERIMGLRGRGKAATLGNREGMMGRETGSIEHWTEMPSVARVCASIYSS